MGVAGRPVLRVIAVCSAGLLGAATLYGLSAAASFVIPVVLALLLDRLLSPLVRRLKSVGLPTPLGAAIVLVVLLGGIGVGVGSLAEPTATWIESAPRTMQEAEYKLRGWKEPLAELQRAAEEVEKATDLDGRTASEASDADRTSLTEALLTQTRSLLSGLVVMTLLLYFLLSSGSSFLRTLVYVLPSFEHRRKAVCITRTVEAELSRYLGTMVLVNAGLGLVIGGALYLFGLPNPVLWGVMAAVLNFVPYLGPLVGVAVVGIVSLVTFDGLGAVALPPLTYFIVNALEGNLITPAVLGWRLTLSPVVVLVSILFWTWLWGIPGGLLAVPMVTTLKIVAANIDTLQPLSLFLVGRVS
jgi:predicted PurR-regulated permease PerM